MIKEWIFKLSGQDYCIIRHCGEASQKRFFSTGLFVLLICIFSFVSSLYTFYQLFGNLLTCILLSTFFSWMITNMHRLLLYTLSKNTLPYPKSSAPVNFSLLIRILFVAFISFTITLPLQLIMFRAALDHDIQIYMMDIKRDNRIKVENYYQTQYDEIRKLSRDKTFVNNFVQRKESEKRRTIQKMLHLIDTSNHFLQRTKFLTQEHPSFWIITILCIAFFIIPIYLNQNTNGDYHQRKMRIERKIVDVNYFAFKRIFSSIIRKEYNKDKNYSEPYEDGPYNTVRKKDNRIFLTEKNLLSELYDA
jgi:hypothetical protein